jgi:hypothetical protein
MRSLGAWLLLPLAGCQLYFGTGTGSDDDIVGDAGAVPDAARACLGQASVCGRVVDVETGTPVTAPISIRFYDAFAYAAGDNTTLEPASLSIDPDGSFRASGVPAPSQSLLAIVVDDRSASTDVFAPTATTVPYGGGEIVATRASAFRHDTDAAWTAAVGLDGTFTDHAATLFTFPLADQPTPGVTVTSDGMPITGAYVFDDATAETHAGIVAGSVTGANGAAVILGIPAGTGSVSGTGGLSNGCVWNDAPRTLRRFGALFVATIDVGCPI